jgi:hypothetical protein
MKKTQLIEQIQLEQAELNSTLASLPPAHWHLPGVVGPSWTVKDIIAHLAVWATRMTDWLQAFNTGTATGTAVPFGLQDAALDQVNHLIYLENREKSRQEVESMRQAAYDRIITLVEAIDETQLMQRVLPETTSGPFGWEIIAANSFEHEREHQEDILTWMGNAALLLSNRE